MDEMTRIAKLQPPEGRVRLVIDTDTYNEIDDQFAIVHALLSPDRLDVEAIYAAPFFAERAPKPRSTGPGDGMEKSYDEIVRVLGLMGRSADGRVYRGSTEYLPDDATPAPTSDAVEDLIARARSSEETLYVMAIGAITNVASAILAAPDIVDRIVVVWLGSHASWWPHTKEFNHFQDVPGVRALFGSGVPLIHIPCMGVASHLLTSPAEMRDQVAGRTAIGDYLVELVETYEYRREHAWSKVIWDIACVGWLLDPKWVPTQLTHAPIAQDDGTFSYSKRRHLIQQAYFVVRDAVYGDLFGKLREMDS
ncbi:MAG: nucleoside hydrolase [Gammaproteobacteria bacterium]|nr:nucleoside hydrolase [Gammaproteobacteria bacterium]